MNRLQLTASVVEREPVRYTPAGVPIASCTLHHRTEVVEAGIARQIELTMPAVAAGEARDAVIRVLVVGVLEARGAQAPGGEVRGTRRRDYEVGSVSAGEERPEPPRAPGEARDLARRLAGRLAADDQGVDAAPAQ